jgi:hypothetical protein
VHSLKSKKFLATFLFDTTGANEKGSQARRKSLRELRYQKRNAEIGISPSAEGLRHFKKGGRKLFSLVCANIYNIKQRPLPIGWERSLFFYTSKKLTPERESAESAAGAPDRLFCREISSTVRW